MASTPDVSSVWRRLLLAVLVAGAVGVLLLAWVAYNLLTVSRETAALRAAVLQGSGTSAQLQVQGSLGPVASALTRLVVRCVPDVPPEAQDALAAVRSVSGAVYRIDATAQETSAARFAAARAVMVERGWVPAVTVREHGSTVLILTRRSGLFRDRLQVCLAVHSNQELIMGEATLVDRELRQWLARLGAEAGEGGAPWGPLFASAQSGGD